MFAELDSARNAAVCGGAAIAARDASITKRKTSADGRNQEETRYPEELEYNIRFRTW
jgi:hypothetical protein